MAWYYKDGDQEIGPVEKEELQKLISAKRIGRQTLVRSSSMKEWKPLGDIVRRKTTAEDSRPPAEESSRTDTDTNATPPEPPPEPPPDTVICSQCGRSFPKDEVVTFDDKVICAACKPMFVQKLKEGATPGTRYHYAGFWIRAGAKIIDWLLLAVVNWGIIIAMGVMGLFHLPTDPENPVFTKGYFIMLGIQQLVGIGIPAFYNTFFIGRYEATLGKMACGLRVITPMSERVSYPRALGRNFAEWISGMILCIGYIMAAFDGEKQALHDRICSTRVVYK